MILAVITKIKKVFDEDINKEVNETPKTTINTKVVYMMKKLQASYNDDGNKIVKHATQEKSAIKNLNFLIDLAMVFNDIKPTMDELQTFNEALNHPNNESCRKWGEAICKEFDDMNNQLIWQKMLKSLMLLNCRCVIKPSSVYWACLVAC